MTGPLSRRGALVQFCNPLLEVMTPFLLVNHPSLWNQGPFFFRGGGGLPTAKEQLRLEEEPFVFLFLFFALFSPPPLFHTASYEPG